MAEAGSVSNTVLPVDQVIIFLKKYTGAAPTSTEVKKNSLISETASLNKEYGNRYSAIFL